MRHAAGISGAVWSAPVITKFAVRGASAGTPPPVEGPTTTRAPTTTVLDEGPRPETRADCKQGGWQRYGTFRNQGDCVSWVATHGKNEPGKNVPGH
jgi:hypothetical protein